MKVFELHFNPKGKEDTIFDSFCYEPINIDEKKLGSLYMAGELKNVLPQNYKLLEDLSSQIKKEYYRTFSRSPEKALIESLKKGNEFLEKLTKEGDVSWLGNLNFAVISLKDYLFQFTKVENILVFLLRGGKITEITENLIREEIEPYPLKVFGNIISGKLSEDDILLILTKEVSEIFQNENLLEDLASLETFTEKKLKELLWKKEKILKEVSGIALLIALTKEPPTFKERIPKLFEFEMEKFSLPRRISEVILWGFIAALSPIKTLILKISRLIKLPALPVLKIPRFQLLRFEKTRKNLILVLIFALVLIIGFYLFQFQEKREIAKIEKNFIQIQEKNQKAENFLILKNYQEANLLFLETWGELSSIEKTLPESEKALNFKNEILVLKGKVESSLSKLNNLIKIEEPELLFNFSQTKLAPQKMVKIGGKLYFFNPATENLFWIDIFKKTGEEIKTERKFNFAQPLNSNSIIFFSKPDILTVFTEPNQFSESKIELPAGDFDFIDFKKFYSNFYLLDKKQGEILKCSLQKCQPWFSKESSKKPENAISLAIDGSIWILNKGDTINRYWSGLYQETLKFDIFPKLEKPTKISIPPTLPYFYILEPAKNRILIIKKSGSPSQVFGEKIWEGEVIKQFQSDKFDNLKDFAISEDGRTIWLLNSLILYQVPLISR